ncbi:histidine kinase [Actinocorallia lasiicapitis]
MKSLLRPLVSGTTWRRFAFLVIGGALFVPFAITYLIFAGMIPIVNGWVGVATVLLEILAFPPVVGMVGLLPVVRSLEGAFTKELVGEPETLGADPAWPSRVRAAAWFAAHVVTGAVFGALCVLTPVYAVMSFVMPFHQGKRGRPQPIQAIVESEWRWLIPVTGILAAVALLALLVLLGRIAAKLAPYALGPSAQELLAAAERRADALAERNRLARELHDSVGHALSIVTVQASAAARVLDRDPDFAKTALSAIEESARAALEDLDHVLGLLREEDKSGRTPQRTLKDLDDLLGNTGLEISFDCEGDLERVPAAVSREAYRIVQEGLTNVAKHAGHVPVRLRLEARAEELELDLTNPRGDLVQAGQDLGGRGLGGLRERVRVLRGTMSAGPQDDLWRVSVTIPITRGNSA